MSDPPAVTLRARTDDDLDVLFEVAADLDTWEERNPAAPAPLTRARFDARRAADPGADAVEFVVDLDGRAVGSVSLFGFDAFARHAEAGISLVPEARGRGIGTAALVQLVEFGFVRRNLHRLREHAWVRGGYEDIVLMGILRADRSTPGT